MTNFGARGPAESSQVMLTALELCIRRKASRFFVGDDGVIHMEQAGKSGIERVEADADPYLKVAVGMSFGDRPRMVDHLIPEKLRSNWRLSVHRERDYTVWTPYLQQLPSLDIDFDRNHY